MCIRDSFPGVGPKPVEIRNQAALFEPDVVRQPVSPIGIVANARQVRPPPILVCKQPQSFCVDSARSPKVNDGPAALLMPLVPRVLAPRAVGQNQVVAGSSQQPCGGLLDLLERQLSLIHISEPTRRTPISY